MDARSHFANRLDHETDVADVAAALRAGEADFVLLDARSRAAYDAGHLPGAVSLHHSEITAESVARPARRAGRRLLLGAELQRRLQGGAAAGRAGPAGQGDAWRLRVLGSRREPGGVFFLTPFADAAALLRLRASLSSSASDSSSIEPNSSMSDIAS